MSKWEGTAICDQCGNRHWVEDMRFFEESSEWECSNCERARASQYGNVTGWALVDPIRDEEHELPTWGAFLTILLGILVILGAILFTISERNAAQYREAKYERCLIEYSSLDYCEAEYGEFAGERQG